VLSAGAIEPGLKAAAAAFEKQNGHAVKITFNTAPELKKRMDANPAFDVVIAPPAVIGEFAAAGKLAETRANVGRVGMGVAVRDGARRPDISSAEGLKRSVLAADSLVFNRASTGLYLEGLLKKMDVYAQVEGKTTRYPDGAAVMEHVIKGKGNEIGFGAMTEILLYQGKGLKFVGPVPAEGAELHLLHRRAAGVGQTAGAGPAVRELPVGPGGQAAVRRGRRDRLMKALLQRVAEARVVIAGETVGQIGAGLLVLVCAERGDAEAQADKLLAKILKLRIFSDEAGKMNLSVQDVKGGLLVVSQFTLAADASGGNRPSFTGAAAPEDGRRLYDYFVAQARALHRRCKPGALPPT
jgi:molybdate transport system substrate-binding protein